MASFFKALISFIQVVLLSFGLIPVSYEVDYGGDDYAAPVVNEALYLVEDGQSEYYIVSADEPDACIQTAVSDLQTYLAKISGATLPYVTESDLPDGAKAIYVGETAKTEALGKDLDAVFEDGFWLTSDGENFFIVGEDSRGTLYGVYTFLEEYLGVRWFTPKLEVVPENDDVVVDKALDRLVEPSFAVRRNACEYSSDAYRAKMKTNVSFYYEAEEFGGAMTFVLWDVTLDRLVPDSLFAQHPEYFAQLEDGSRTTDHVCLSNPAVLQIAVANARTYIENCEYKADHLHIGQKDNSNYCRCANCTALYEKYGALSAPTILFTNALADALDEDYPEFTFTFYSYLETEHPPKDLSLRCNDNVVPVLCGLHHACRSHSLTECGATDEQQTGLDEFMNLYGEHEPTIAEDHKVWVALADRTYIYDYTINFLFTQQFHSNFGTMQETMKYMHDIGITGYVYNCGDDHSAAFNELRNYLLCKLQWDVNADVEYHMMDFMNAYYGEEAAPIIKEILDIQTAQIAATAHSFDFDWHYQSGYYPVHIIIKLDNLWDKALSANVTNEQLFNVETASLSWEFFKANQFLGEYNLANPLRGQANEDLYDAFKAHNIHRISSFSLIPEKEDINFFFTRPIEW
ncbi:MAG: DUF4838 domain-containing protein [Clostridia bacterium]|nr:DUF4838 domain-containing protein [Clostridia bacterium]